MIIMILYNLIATIEDIGEFHIGDGRIQEQFIEWGTGSEF
jgi:hypothetical protein